MPPRYAEDNSWSVRCSSSAAISVVIRKRPDRFSSVRRVLVCGFHNDGVSGTGLYLASWVRAPRTRAWS